MKNKNVEKLVTSAIMIALATVLSMLKIWELPMGGSITLFSMLPICVIGYKYGVKHGLYVGFVYGLFQLILGVSGLKGLSLATVIGAIFLDYLIAFSVLGFSGLFRNNKKMSLSLSLALGCGLAGFLRFLCHFISGYLLWAIWAEKVGWAAIVYSFQYNISYMGIETVLTVIAAGIIGAAIPKNLLINNK
ncbi:MAG: thiT [Clostridiales bacterium]|jgi:thiamine transporter|nr:thiT [Clostridiales bacterium]